MQLYTIDKKFYYYNTVVLSPLKPEFKQLSITMHSLVMSPFSLYFIKQNRLTKA